MLRDVAGDLLLPDPLVQLGRVRLEHLDVAGQVHVDELRKASVEGLGTPAIAESYPAPRTARGTHTYQGQSGRHGHPGFYRLLDEMADLHDRKNHDYAGDDPLSNLKLCSTFGIAPWLGVIVRLTDKWSRITQLATKEAQVTDESIEDTLLDNAVYSLLAIVLRREQEDL